MKELQLLFKRDPFYAFDFNDVLKMGKKNKFPTSDIYENEEEYVIELEMPGINREELSIDIDKNVLTIKAKKINKSNEKNNNKIVYVESSYMEFERSFYIPDNVETKEDKISASYKDGILEIHMQKKKEKEKTKKIQVKFD